MKAKLIKAIENIKDLKENQEKMGIPTGGLEEIIEQLTEILSKMD